MQAGPTDVGAFKSAIDGGAGAGVSTTGACASSRIVLAAIGLGVAAYLTYVHYEGIKPVCGLGGDCEKVQTSEWSKLAGVPVALLGLIGYAAILATLFVEREEALVAGALLRARRASASAPT